MTIGVAPDGISKTIHLTEKYARCTNAVDKQGGSLWAYWIGDASIQPLHPVLAYSNWKGYAVGPDASSLCVLLHQRL